MTKIAQIASSLGLSTASVSRALNGKPGVGEDVRSRILAEAARLNYAVNSAAHSLKTSRTMNIAFVLRFDEHAMQVGYGPLGDEQDATPLGEPFYGPILLGAERELQGDDYHLLLSTLNDEQLARPEQWSILRSRRADGLLVVGPDIPAAFMLAMQMQQMPLVGIDNTVANVAMDLALAEDRQGAHQIAQHLVEHGHQRFVILMGPDTWVTNAERRAGFLDALHAASIEPLAVLHGERTNYETGYRLMQAALDQQPSAILAVNDALALGAIDAARAAGQRVPGQIAVTGFDNISLAARGIVPLTTVHIPKDHLGRIGVRLLLNRLAHPDAPKQRTLVATSLIVRASCGCNER